MIFSVHQKFVLNGETQQVQILAAFRSLLLLTSHLWSRGLITPCTHPSCWEMNICQGGDFCVGSRWYLGSNSEQWSQGCGGFQSSGLNWWVLWRHITALAYCQTILLWMFRKFHRKNKWRGKKSVVKSPDVLEWLFPVPGFSWQPSLLW